MSFLRKNTVLKNLYRASRHTSSSFATDTRLFLWNSTHGNRVVTHQFLRQSSSVAPAAIHKYERNGEHQKTIDVTTSNIDEALSNIDLEAKHVGRVSRKDVEAVYHKVMLLGTASAIQSLYMIRCCGALMRDDLPSRRTELVNKIWNLIQELEIPVDASHYNSLLKVYLENGYKFSPTDFLSAMENRNVAPNRVTYQRLIETYCMDGDLSGASAILEFMKEKGIAVNEAVFNSLIKGHAKANDLEGARNMLEIMRKSQLFPSVDSYTTMACCFAEKGDVKNITSILEEAKQNELYISDKNYLQIIYSLAISGHGHYVDTVLLEMTNIREYREECINAVCDLLNQGLHDVAFKIVLKLAENFPYNNGTALFVQRLIETGQPAEKVLEYCRDIKRSGFDDYIFTTAAKSALMCKHIDLAIELFKSMTKEGVPIRSHYFWPILGSHLQQRNAAGIWTTLKVMYELGLPADFDTYMDFVFPGISTDDPETIIDKIKEIGQSEISVVDPLFQYYCNSGDLKNACHLITNYAVRINSKIMLKVLANQYTPSIESDLALIQILKYVAENAGPRIEHNTQKDLYGQFFLYLADQNKLSENLLKEACIKDIRLSRPTANAICEKLQNTSPELMHLIKNLEHGVNIPVTTEQSSPHPRDMDLEDLEKHVLILKQRGASTRAALRHLLTLHSKKRNVDRVIEIKAELEEQGFTFSPASYALLINLFSSFNNLEAIKYKKQLEEEYPEFQLDTNKAIEYMTMLIKYNKVEEALEVLKKDCKEVNLSGHADITLRSIRRLLNAAAELGNVELTNMLYNFFPTQLNLSAPNTALLEVLVKVHLIREDLDKAIEEYKRCILAYHLFPARGYLFKKCIQRDDSVRLQKVVDLTTMYGGKTAALHELAYTFIETGRIHQANKVIQTLGEKADSRYFEDMCSRLFKLNKGIELEQLINSTKTLFHIDRDKLYYYLLQLYAKNNDYQRALELWNSLQEENVHPRIKTLCLLADVLQNNKQPVPFVVPNKNSNLDSDQVVEDIKSTEFVQEPKEKLIECIDMGNISEAVEVLRRMKKGHVRSLSVNVMTSIVDLLIVNKSLKDISSIVQVMSYCLENANEIFKPILEKYADAGDVDVLKMMFDFLPEFTQKSLHYNYFLHKAYIHSGKGEELLSELEQNINKSNKIFSAAGFQELLKSCPHLEEKATKLADHYMEKENFDIPRKVLWVHSFIHEQYEKADEIYKQNTAVFLNMDHLTTQIIKTVRNTKNESMGKKLIELTDQCNMKQRIKDRAYSCLLDVLVDQVKQEEAVALIAEAEKLQIPLERFNRTTLISLQNSLEERNQAVPFNIPENDTSSSSDSE